MVPALPTSDPPRAGQWSRFVLKDKQVKGRIRHRRPGEG